MLIEVASDVQRKDSESQGNLTLCFSNVPRKVRSYPSLQFQVQLDVQVNLNFKLLLETHKEDRFRLWCDHPVAGKVVHDQRRDGGVAEP
jgi:hypothetical protein